jgi:hypothetical protein
LDCTINSKAVFYINFVLHFEINRREIATMKEILKVQDIHVCITS